MSERYSGRVSGEIDGLPMSVSGQFGPVSPSGGGPFELDLDTDRKNSYHKDICRRTSSGGILLKFTGYEFAKGDLFASASVACFDSPGSAGT
jgi:hypothetical protein